MTTSLQTKFLSGGYSIQRNEMISLPQKSFRQRFQFMNTFNQTFSRIDKPAQGLGKRVQDQIDRIPAFKVASVQRQLVNGIMSAVEKPLTFSYATGTDKATLGDVQLDENGAILSLSITDGGTGYAPGVEYAVCIRGGNKSGNTVVPADIKVRADGLGRISSFTIVDPGREYTKSGDAANNMPAMSIEVDETPMLGQFVVSRFNGLAQTGVVGTGTAQNPQIPAGVGAVTSLTPTGTLTGHREGVWFVQHGNGHTLTVLDKDGNASLGKLETLKFQVYVNSGGEVGKVTITEFAEAFELGDIITVTQSQLGGISDNSTGPSLTLTVSSVTDKAQVDRDFGTVIWRSETFEQGVDVVMEYTIDTTVDLETSNGFLRTFAEDLCLHPYANYYSSAWTTQKQRNATLTFSGLSELVTSSAHSIDLVATLTDPETGDTLSATDGFQIKDIGKRIIEPFGTGTVVITGVGTGGSPDNVTAGAAICSIATLSGAAQRTTEDVNSWEDKNKLVYIKDRWRLAIQRTPYTSTYDSNSATDATNFPGMVINEGGFESQPYNLIYPRLDNSQTDHIYIRPDGQQNHREVMGAIRRIGDLFVVESEKATDILSSRNDINAATKSVPTTVNLTQPVRDRRKPQKWRMRFYYDSRDEYLYVNVATPLQILDDGNLASGQGRDGIKPAIFRQPGELSEIYHNFSNDTNKAKVGFFRRQGKTDSGIDGSYPIAYRLTCTDHGTGFFLFDQASVDQDDDYAWFVVQRHVNNVSGKIESEDGKSPVHCLYSPSKRPEEQSNFNTGFYAELTSSVDASSGATTVTTKSIGELQIYDINGSKLRAGLPLNNSISTKGGLVPSRSNAYGRDQTFAQSQTGGIPLTDGAGLGTDVISGFTATNDFFQFPSLIGTAKAGSVVTDPKTYESAGLTNLDGSAVIDTAFTPDRTDFVPINGFNLNYPSTVSDSTFVPVGDYFSPMNTAVRFTATHDTEDGTAARAGTNVAPVVSDNLEGSASLFTKAFGQNIVDSGGTSAPIEHYGLKNYTIARNQMQGPTKLGLSLSRVRHRSADGIETILDPVKDISIINRQEKAASVDQDGKPRELPISSAVAIFTPTSSAAKQLVTNRRIKVVYYDTIEFAYADAGADADAAITNSALPADSAAVTTSAGEGYGQALTYIFGNTVLRATSLLGPAAANVVDTALWSTAEAELVPIQGFGDAAGNTKGFVVDVDMFTDRAVTSESTTENVSRGAFSTKPGAYNIPGGQITPKLGDLVTLKGEHDTSYKQTGSIKASGAKITNIVDTFPEGDMFIYEYSWNGAGANNEYVNFYGRSGIASHPLFEVNRIKIFVDGQEADSAILGQNYNVDNDGVIQFGDTTSSLEYFGSAKPIYAYNMQSDTFKFAQGLEDGVVVKISYENYNDVEERDTGKNTFLIKIPEDRDIPNIWKDIHKVAKGIYRFCVRESDVFKPWDYHVSAVIPQVDSPACINPVEQLSITQDKTVIFNFPTPLASQRFIYSDAEADMICIAGADSSTQGGIIKTATTKFDLDSFQHSGYKNTADDPFYPSGSTQFGLDANGVVSDANVSTSSNSDNLNFRREYYWHNPHQGAIDSSTGNRVGATATPALTAFDTPTNSTHRTYLGMMSTKPFGNGMRLFILARGGPVRPQYTDYTPRDQVDANNNTFT